MINTKLQPLPQRIFQINKYVDPYNNNNIISVNNMMLSEYSYPPLGSNYEVLHDNLEYFLHNYICNDNKLQKIEFKNYEDSKRFEDASCSLIVVTNMITNVQQYIIPKRYGENVEQFLSDNPNLKNGFHRDNMITTKQFIDNFNNIHTKQRYVLTPDNMNGEIQKFFQCNNFPKSEVLEIIEAMINTGDYYLSNEFKTHKLDLQNLQSQFDLYISSNHVSKNEILAEVFNIDNTVSLI